VNCAVLDVAAATMVSGMDNSDEDDRLVCNIMVLLVLLVLLLVNIIERDMELSLVGSFVVFWSGCNSDVDVGADVEEDIVVGDCKALK
jgi:hypothetical protein